MCLSASARLIFLVFFWLLLHFLLFNYFTLLYMFYVAVRILNESRRSLLVIEYAINKIPLVCHRCSAVCFSFLKFFLNCHDAFAVNLSHMTCQSNSVCTGQYWHLPHHRFPVDKVLVFIGGALFSLSVQPLEPSLTTHFLYYNKKFIIYHPCTGGFFLKDRTE